MADIRVQVPDEFMDALRKNTHLKTNSEIVQEALTLLNWALHESKQGRLIFSTDETGGDVARLVMHALDVARLSAPKAPSKGATGAGNLRMSHQI